MGEHEAVRTLVKSAPELWDVCSDPDSLGRHLEAFGEIRITRVEPETTVAWEGDRVSGTVRIEPSGWGTRVTLTARSSSAEPVGAAVEPEPVAAIADPEPAVEPEPVVAVPEPEPEPVVAVEPAPVVEPDEPPAGPEPAAPPSRRGIFRRLGGLLFRSFVTPVEVPEEAFAPPVLPEPTRPGDGVPAATGPDPEVALLRDSDPEPEPVVEPESAHEPLLTGHVADPDAGPPPSAESTDVDPALVLETMLSRLGSDHHRPFSRA